MRLVLDPVVVTRGYRVAALSAVQVAVTGGAGMLAGGGDKQPLALLIEGPGGMLALGPDGAALTRDAVEALLPGVWARFAAGGGTG